MPPLVVGDRLTLAHPDHVVLDDVTLGLAAGDRIGLVGRNGAGKSTLLRLLAGRQRPDSGRVTWRRGLRVGHLDQDDRLPPDRTAREVVVGDRPEHEWASDARIRGVLEGLLRDVDWTATIGTLSGGQRRRVGLAGVLVGDHDLVVLDEPTNHLDLEGVTWLAEHIGRRWPGGSGGLAVVTHDRWFLDAVCTTTWEVHDGTVDAFEGGYAAYVLQRVERDRQAAATETRRRNLMRKELAWLRRGAPARTSKPKFRLDAAAELVAREPPPRDRTELLRLATARLGKDVVDLHGVGVVYDERPVLRDIDWRIGPGDRIGILGVNGAGKSTLLGLVTGAVHPTSGRVRRGKTVRVQTLTQSAGTLAEVADERVVDVVGRYRRTTTATGDELEAKTLLERLGFAAAQWGARVGDLSGGQRRRLQLVLVLLAEPNVLVLDEPTNDLDTDMLAATEDLLDSWPGTLLVVSHDRYLLERVTDQQYAVLDGRLRHLPGGVEEYLRLRRVEEDPAAATTTGTEPTSGARAHRDRKEAARLERRIEKLAAREQDLHTRMTEAGTDVGRLQELERERREVAAEREAAEDAWLVLET